MEKKTNYAHTKALLYCLIGQKLYNIGVATILSFITVQIASNLIRYIYKKQIYKIFKLFIILCRHWFTLDHEKE